MRTSLDTLKGILRMSSFKIQFLINFYISWDKKLSHFSEEVDPGHLIEGKSV